MKNKRFTVFLTVVLTAVIVLLCIFTPIFKIISSWIGNILTPVQTGITSVTASVENVFAGWGNTKKIAEENKQLKAEIDKLKVSNQEWSAYKKENDRLKDLLDLKNQKDSFSPVAATVIGKNAGNWFNVFTVNKGKDDGVVENTPVISSKGVVGRVSQVGKNWSKIVSVINYDHSVSGMISRTEDLVQIDGDLSLMKDGLLKMIVITEGADIIIGDTVVTSGIGGIYPKGLFVGTVTEFRNNKEGTGKYAVVKPDVDFQRVYDVLLLTGAGE